MSVELASVRCQGAADEDAPVDLNSVLDAMPVAVALADLATGHTLFLNRKLAQVYGYRPGDTATIWEWADLAFPEAEQGDRVVRALRDCLGVGGSDGRGLSAAGEAPARPAPGSGRSGAHPLPPQREFDSLEVDVRCKDGSLRTAILGGRALPERGWAMVTLVDITDRKRDEVLTRQLAEEDALTGLPNRRAFEVHLENAVADARRDGQGMHLLLLDLDRFKVVNDRLGHHAGDLLLQAVAERLKACVRGSDVVARFGGDEFAIVLRRSGSDAVVGRIGDKILATMRAPFTIAGEAVRIGASIGISRFPDDATRAADLFVAADRALYRVKEQGRGHWRYALDEA